MENVVKIYGLTNDVVFKYVFGSCGNEKLSVCLLNALLGLEDPDEIVHVVFLNPFSTKAYPTDRGSIVDVKVTDARGQLFFIEVQVATQSHFAERAVYYGSKTFSEQLKAGQGFESLKKTTGISILDFSLFEDDLRVHRVYRLRDIEGDRELTDTLELHFVELDKVDITKPRSQMTRFEKWMYVFRKSPLLAGGAEMLPAEFTDDEELTMIIDQIKKVNADTEMRTLIEGQERWEHDVASRLYDARQAGREECREEALAEVEAKGEAKAEAKAVAISMNLISQGIDIKIIEQATGLPRDTLENLAKSKAAPPKP